MAAALSEPDLGQEPPHSLDAERNLLACAIQFGKPELLEDLEPEDFYLHPHALIARAVKEAAAAGVAISNATIGAALAKKQQRVAIEAMPHVFRLAKGFAGGRGDAELVREMAKRRRMIVALRRPLAGLSSGLVGVDEAIAEIGRFVSSEAATGARCGIGSVGVDEVFAPLPPIAWLVEGLRLAPGAAAALAGSSFAGKTITAQSIALACAAGRPVFDVFRVDACPVRHLDYEQGRRITYERYQRLARGMGIDRRELDERLVVSPLPTVYLDSPNACDVFAREFEGFGLVIVDSLRAAAPSADENSSEVRRYIDILTRAGEKTGALPLIIHHARKPSADSQGGAKASIRGSSAIFDACGCIFVLDAEKGEPTRVRHEKDRIIGTTLPDFGLRVEDVEIDGDPRAGVRVVHLEAEQLATAREARGEAELERVVEKVRDCIAATPGIRGKDAIRRAVRLGAAKVREAVDVLIDRGEVEDRASKGSALYVVSAREAHHA